MIFQDNSQQTLQKGTAEIFFNLRKFATLDSLQSVGFSLKFFAYHLADAYTPQIFSKRTKYSLKLLTNLIMSAKIWYSLNLF